MRAGSENVDRVFDTKGSDNSNEPLCTKVDRNELSIP